MCCRYLTEKNRNEKYSQFAPDIYVEEFDRFLVSYLQLEPGSGLVGHQKDEEEYPLDRVFAVETADGAHLANGEALQ